MPGTEVIELLVSWVVTTALTFVVVILDERRLSEEQIAHAWPVASRNLYLVYLGVLAVPFHFAKTRGSWSSVRGICGIALWFLLGVVIAFLVAIVASLAITGILMVIGIPQPE